MTTKRTYLKKHRLFPDLILDQPDQNLNMVVVIPCHNEPSVLDTLQSLWDCQRPECAVEVILIINSAEHAPDHLIEKNTNSFWEIERWKKNHKDPGLKFYTFNFHSLPYRHAGVGLARKIGMDEAVARFDSIGNKKGIIISLDADCQVEENYFAEIERHYRLQEDCPAATVYFEHPLKGPQNPKLYEGIMRYELYLRYYIQGLNYAGYPYASHTVGSCITVRSDAYEAQNGMNKRKAGEDFYFLHKLMPLRGFGEICTTTVYPATRVSDRVPFGTGKAMKDWMVQKHLRYMVYHPESFEDLRKWLSLLPDFYEASSISDYNNIIIRLPPSVIAFLSDENFYEKWIELKQETSSEDTFINRFYGWLNGLKVLHFIHFIRDHFYGQVMVEEAANQLLYMITEEGTENDAFTLLMHYRKIDKFGWELVTKANKKGVA